MGRGREAVNLKENHTLEFAISSWKCMSSSSGLFIISNETCVGIQTRISIEVQAFLTVTLGIGCPISNEKKNNLLL